MTAIKDNFVPRDTTTLAPTDLAGDLGGASYRWDNSYIKKQYIGTVSNNNTIEESGSDIAIKISGTTKGLIGSTGFDGQYLKAASVAQAALGTANTQVSSSCGTFSTSSTSLVDVTNLSISITTTGRPVYVGLISSGTFGGATSADMFSGGLYGIVSFLRASSEIGSYLVSPSVGKSSFFTIDAPSAGTYTYKVQAATQAASFTINYYKLFVFEL